MTSNQSILAILQSLGGASIKLLANADYGGNDFPVLVITARCSSEELAKLMREKIKERLGEAGEINGIQFRHYRYTRDGDTVIEFGMNNDGWLREEQHDETKRLLQGLGLPDHLTIGGDAEQIRGTIAPLIAKDLKGDVNRCLELSQPHTPTRVHSTELA